MTTTVESEIIEALSAHLSTMADVWPIAFENVDPGSLTNTRHLRTQHIPGPPRSYTLGRGFAQFIGIFQITVVVEKGIGAILPNTEVSKIVQHFERMGTISCPSGLITITERPASAGGLDGGATYDTPISIRYELIAN
tara:strand:+ start:7221 stop:7634 length:414 start_codon:yes stop_codon:yes gene_type:complete